MLGNLHGLAGNIAELRNPYGSGHGKSASFKGLNVRHTMLAVGSSITLVNYLWDTYEWREGTGRIR
ncbi:MAG: abortive infection family protein [Clostridiales bacterium]|nr:abortive infection family protein [Clostridiales bacterium]